ncbi:MAG: hypothetical protein WB579_21825 [Bryobacteraceae bacterium]
MAVKHPVGVRRVDAGALRTPDVIPLLESVLDAWKPGDYYEAPHEALQSLYALDPARAQARIVTELSKERTWLDAPQLDLLPASVAQISDDTLIEALAAAQRGGGWNIPLTSALAQAAPRTWHFTCDYYNLDVKGNLAGRQRYSASYTRGLPGDVVRWSDGAVG